MANRRQPPNQHPAMLPEALGYDVGAAVDRDLVASIDQPCAKFLGEGLEPSVGGGHAARSQDRDAHRGRVREPPAERV